MEGFGICYDVIHNELEVRMPALNRCEAFHLDDQDGTGDVQLWPFDGVVKLPQIQDLISTGYSGPSSSKAGTPNCFRRGARSAVSADLSGPPGSLLKNSRLSTHSRVVET